MIYCKTDSNGKILEVLEGDEEFARANGYTEPCNREIVQVYNGTYKFADEVTDADFLPSLDEVKAEKIAEIKTLRDAKEVEPLQTSKGTFDYDDKSRDRLAIARQALMDNEGMESILWTTADNQRVPLTVADFAEINSMAAYRSNSLHIMYNELKVMVNEAQTIEDVEAIGWED